MKAPALVLEYLCVNDEGLMNSCGFRTIFLLGSDEANLLLGAAEVLTDGV